MRRYDIDGEELEVTEDASGEFVKYDDVFELLTEIMEEAGECRGRTGQYISDLCNI